MIEKEGGLYILYCDVCGNAADKDFYMYHNAVEYKMKNGWKSQRHPGKWDDVCPECQEGGEK